MSQLTAHGIHFHRPIAWVRNGCVLSSLAGRISATNFQSLNEDSRQSFPENGAYDEAVDGIERAIAAHGGMGEVDVVVHSELFAYPGFITLLEQRLGKQVLSDIDAVVSASIQSQGDYTVVDVGRTTTEVLSWRRGPDGYSIKEKARSSSEVVLRRIASALSSFCKSGTEQPELLHLLFDFNTVENYNAVLADTNRYGINKGVFPEMPFNFRTQLKQVLTNELTNAEFFRIVAEALREHALSFKPTGTLIVKSPLTSYSPMKDCSTGEVTFQSELDLLTAAKDSLTVAKRSSHKNVEFKAHPSVSSESTPCGLWLFCDVDDPRLQLALNDQLHNVSFAELLPLLRKTSFTVGDQTMCKVHIGIDLDGCDNVVMKLRTIDGQVSERILN